MKKFIIIIVIINQILFSQDGIQVHGGVKYAKYNNTWYLYSENKGKGDLVDTNNIIIRLKDKAILENNFFEKISIPQLKNVRGRFSNGFYELEIPKNINSMKMLKTISESELIEIAYLNIFGLISEIEPNDSCYEESMHWNLEKINMPKAWTITTGYNNVKVAVLDMGVEYDHDDLQKNIYSYVGYDFYDYDNNPEPENLASSSNAHGTCVAGIICSNTNNNLGVSGIAGGWGIQKGVSLISYRIGINRIADFAAAADAFDDAIENDIDIISCSWGSTSDEYIPEYPGETALQSSIDSALTEGIIVIFSSGNQYVTKDSLVRWPANMTGVIAVGATTKNDERKEFDGVWGSCYGQCLDFVAPGVEIPTTDNSGQYGYSSNDYHTNFKGTSAAAPHVAATAALIKSINPSLSGTTIRNIICDTAIKLSGYTFDEFGINEEVGFGRIDAYKALKYTLKYYGGTLTQNINVSSGDTLEFGSNSSINLNSFNIKTTGGVIDINAGASITPDIRIINGTNIKGLYATLDSAIYDADSGDIIEVRDDYTITNSLTINSGKTIKFASGKYLEIESGGNLTATGATFTSTSGTWGGIKYNSGSTGSLTNCTISNATCGVYLNADRSITNCTITTDGSYNYGIYINSASPTILDCNITGSEFFSTSNVSYGIYCYGGAPYIINNTIDATYGIYNYSSSPYVKNNNVTSELVGLYCENSSPYLAEYADHGHNDFQGSYSECGVWATNGSHPVLGTQDCGWGENKFVYNDVEALAYAETGSSIYAKYNWWGSSAPSSSLFIGDVTYLPCLASSPVFSPQAPSPENNLYDTRMMLAGAIPDSVEEGSEYLLRYYNDQWDLDKKIGFLRYLYMLGEAEGVTDLCKEIIEKNPYEPEAFTALDLIYQIAKNEKVKKDFDKEMLKTYLKTFEDSRSNPLLKANAMLMLAGVEKDVARMDEVYAANKNTYMGKHALRKKFMYYFHDEADLKLARAVLNEMDEVYPNEAVTYESHVLIGDEVMDPKEFYSQYFKKDAPKQIQIASTGIDEIIPKEYALNPAFPNPFNPSTTLEFALPVQSDVECSIFNLRGNLVKEYSYEQNAGT
ncbi:MAG: S8 family serine peptidase, partial [Candidatus Marinimicrobia bacterium]|nr:S8 family serine peptidase [Candidatus Neomarinimicrobiota bacterium]